MKFLEQAMIDNNEPWTSQLRPLKPIGHTQNSWLFTKLHTPPFKQILLQYIGFIVVVPTDKTNMSENYSISSYDKVY